MRDAGSRSQSDSEPGWRHGEAEQLRHILGTARSLDVETLEHHRQQSLHFEQGERPSRAHARTGPERNLRRRVMRAGRRVEPSRWLEGERIDEVRRVDGLGTEEEQDRRSLGYEKFSE